ncbi:MAG: N-acetylmuramoyl-L-alanine amidase [Lachnospiraceae bacterium]|nr:N-acetylmuramoyl-L-alanine amidase [Lachnospiraceae bacterium]
MAATIVIDPGHGGSDPGAVYNGRREKDDNLRLALAVGKLLEQRGYNVVYTRTEDVFDTPGEKARIANRAGGDYFVSFHRNSSPYANTYSGVETLVFADEGVKGELARSVNSELEKAGFNNLGVKERTNLTVLKRTQMPAILIEAGFLNTEADNRTFDNNFDSMANAIATGISNVVGGTTGSSGGTTGSRTYRVQTGLFRRYGNAQFMLQGLIENGFEAEIVESGEFFAVQVGNYTSLDAARNAQTQLQNLGYDTLIVTVK